MTMVDTEFELNIPDGKIIAVFAQGRVFEEGDTCCLEDVTFEVWLFRNSADVKGKKLTDEQIQDFKRWCDLDEIVDHKLYSRWEQIKEEGPEWERDAG
jgi:hypothetical protein